MRQEVRQEVSLSSNQAFTSRHTVIRRSFSKNSFDLRDRLWKLMKSYCTMVDIDSATLSGQDGFLASGYARVKSGFGKQVCYSGIVALPSGAVGQRDFVVLAHFTNASLNEQLVKTMHIDYVGQTVKIQA